MSQRDPVKVVLTTEKDGQVYVETPWALPVGLDTFELDNLPFYAYGLSLGDCFSPRQPRMIRGCTSNAC